MKNKRTPEIHPAVTKDLAGANVVDLEAARIKRYYVGKQCWNCSKVVESVGLNGTCPSCGQPLEPF